MNNQSKELQILIPLVKKVGEEIMKIYNADFKYELKQDNSPLTKADILSNNLLIETLLKEFPDYGIISEESKNEEDVYSKEKIWVLDPLDGTKDFIQKTDEFSIMIALLENKKPILGIVYAPAINKLYYAEKNKGTYLIQEEIEIQINVTRTESLDEFRLIRSRNHFLDKDKKISEDMKISSFIKMGSVGVKFGAIAEGNSEICYYTTDQMGIWDDAASHIILKEAGGEVFDLNGNEPEYDLKGRKMKFGFIGTNGTNKEKILKAINS